ncbi:MAG: EF-hand domain-containing protein [Alphaproteobacteria bacterium]|nr:EF-hand domain-containing protein [Alphaproteobacteria bacterium]
MEKETTKRKWYCTRWGVAGILLAVLIVGICIGKISSHHGRYGGWHGDGHHGNWHGEYGMKPVIDGDRMYNMQMRGDNMRGGMYGKAMRGDGMSWGMRGGQERGGGMMRNLITQADSNGDFIITEQEFENLFNQLDSNKDGVLESETMQARKAQREQMWQQMRDDDDDDDDDKFYKKRNGIKGQFMLDSDDDGKISKDEFMAIFTRMDINQDGVINNELFKLNAS